MSATVAFRAAIIESASSETATHAHRPIDIRRPSMEASAITGQLCVEPKGVIVPLVPVTSKAVRASGIEPLDAEQRPQLGPTEVAVTRDQHEQEVVGAAANHHRLHDVARLDTAHPGGFGKRVHPAVPGHDLFQAQLTKCCQCAFGAHHVLPILRSGKYPAARLW